MNRVQRYWDSRAALESKTNRKRAKQFEDCKNLLLSYFEPETNVVDLGCGTGFVAYELANYVKAIHAIDFSEAMISLAKARKRSPQHDHIHFELGNIEYTGLKDNSFDACLLCNLINHVENPEVIMNEAKRLVIANGLVVSSTYCHASIRSIRSFLMLFPIFFFKLLNKPSHIKVFTFKSLRKELESNGMVIIAEKRIKHNGISGLFTILKT